MTTAKCHETARLHREIESLRRELAHAANARATMADQLATTRAELDEAVRLGTEYATALAWAVPSHPMAA